ncbi:MAG: glycosyltransferase, partial [Xanthobacteraceae bacterium]
MNTAIVIDPGLADGNGHHRAVVVGWVEAAHASGFDTRVLGSVRGTLDAIDIIPVEKVLSTWPYAAIPPERPSAQRLLRGLQRRFRDEVARPLREADADDILILAHATQFALNGIAAWAAGRAPERRPRLAVWLNTAPQHDEFTAACGSTAALAAAFDRLRALFGDRATFLVSEPDYVERYQDLQCGPFEWLPFLALRRELQPAAPRVADDRVPHVAVVGHFGRRKGVQFVAEIMRRIAAHDIAVRWTIAGSLFETAPLDLDDLARAAKAHGDAEVVIEPEGLDDYDDRLRAANLVLLPYSPDHYALRGSGVAQEAELLGIPYVAPRVTFSEAAAKAGAARTFDAWTADSIAATLADALRDLPQLSCNARSFAQQQSAAVKDARRDVLLRVFGSSASPAMPPPAAGDLPQPALPGVDIIVTLHNYARFLRRCLASVTQQTYPNWRCVVVDDGSTDIDNNSLRALVASFGPRFSLASHVLAEGQIRAVATGLSLGSNPFVVMLDADDRLEPRALD